MIETQKHHIRIQHFPNHKFVVHSRLRSHKMGTRIGTIELFGDRFSFIEMPIAHCNNNELLEIEEFCREQTKAHHLPCTDEYGEAI